MRYWIVRAKPDWNDPFEDWIVPNRVGRWQTKRPPRTWDKGDRIFVWASSPRQEILGLSELYGLPTNPDREGKYWFRLRYLSGVLRNPVARTTLSTNSILRKSILLKHGPSFSVVRLSDQEGEELYRLVAQQNPDTRSIWPDLLTRSKTATLMPIDSNMKTPKTTPFPNCIYTIASAHELDSCIRVREGADFLDQGKHWKMGREMLVQANRSGQVLPLLLGNAATTDGVRWLAVIEDIELLDSGRTRVSYRGLHRTSKPIPLHRLVVASTGKHLSDNFIRPYALCRTPATTFDSLQRWAQKSRWFSVIDYISALKEIEPRISDGQRAMLIGHYAAPAGRLSEAQLANLGGYAAGRAANLHYGKLGGLVATELGYKPSVALTWTLAKWDGHPDEKGHGQWVLRKEVARALEDLGWVNPDSVVEDAEAAKREILERDPELVVETPTIRKALIDARMGQGKFRSDLIKYWGSCAVTRCSQPEVIVASHIVPWANATNKERLDPFNGLLLTRNIDALFDRYLISFQDDGSILLSDSLNQATRRALGLSPGLKLIRIDKRHLPYLAKHRERFFE